MGRPIDPRRIQVIDEVTAAILRSKEPWERVAMTAECNDTVRALINGRLRTDHPDWSNSQIAAEIARRMAL